MTREDKIKSGNMVISNSGYADTLIADLTSVGLTVVDTYDEALYQRIINDLAPLWYNDNHPVPEFSRRHVVILAMAAIRAHNDRKKKIGKVPGKKPKKVK